MASTNKCLAQSNKSQSGGHATTLRDVRTPTYDDSYDYASHSHHAHIGGVKVRRPAALFGMSLLAGLVAPTSFALSQNLSRSSCSELWYERNSIFKDAGYCFKTPRAIRTFGNAGCAYDSQYDVPLSDRDRQFVNAIQRIEREHGCPR